MPLEQNIFSYDDLANPITKLTDTSAPPSLLNGMNKSYHSKTNPLQEEVDNEFDEVGDEFIIDEDEKNEYIKEFGREMDEIQYLNHTTDIQHGGAENEVINAHIRQVKHKLKNFREGCNNANVPEEGNIIGFDAIIDEYKIKDIIINKYYMMKYIKKFKRYLRRHNLLQGGDENIFNTLYTQMNCIRYKADTNTFVKKQDIFERIKYASEINPNDFTIIFKKVQIEYHALQEKLYKILKLQIQDYDDSFDQDPVDRIEKIKVKRNNYTFQDVLYFEKYISRLIQDNLSTFVLNISFKPRTDDHASQYYFYKQNIELVQDILKKAIKIDDYKYLGRYNNHELISKGGNLLKILQSDESLTDNAFHGNNIMYSLSDSNKYLSTLSDFDFDVHLHINDTTHAEYQFKKRFIQYELYNYLKVLRNETTDSVKNNIIYHVKLFNILTGFKMVILHKDVLALKNIELIDRLDIKFDNYNTDEVTFTQLKHDCQLKTQKHMSPISVTFSDYIGDYISFNHSRDRYFCFDLIRYVIRVEFQISNISIRSKCELTDLGFNTASGYEQAEEITELPVTYIKITLPDYNLCMLPQQQRRPLLPPPPPRYSAPPRQPTLPRQPVTRMILTHNDRFKSFGLPDILRRTYWPAEDRIRLDGNNYLFKCKNIQYLVHELLSMIIFRFAKLNKRLIRVCDLITKYQNTLLSTLSYTYLSLNVNPSLKYNYLDGLFYILNIKRQLFIDEKDEPHVTSFYNLRTRDNLLYRDLNNTNKKIIEYGTQTSIQLFPLVLVVPAPVVYIGGNNYKNKYLKYKNKYLQLKNITYNISI
jgi:hypothetical protein